MAAIGKIREKSTLLLIMIGGAMLLFILGDIVSSGGSVFQRGQTIVGEVSGDEVDVREFEQMVQESIENYKANYEQSTIDAKTQDLIRKQTWEQMVRNKVLGDQRDELGVTVTSDELFDMVQGSDPDPRVVQAFTDPNTGQFNPANVVNFLKNLDNDPAAKQRWLDFEQDLKKQRQNTKYYNLIKKGIYITDAQAANDYKATNRRADIRFVAKRYVSLPDSAVKVTDSDVKEYYNEHKQQYEQEESRDIEFVTFDVVPSEDDDQEVKHWIEQRAEEFKNTDDDTLFVNLNSDNPYREIWYAAENLPDGLDTAFADAEDGDVVGPYKVDNTYKVVKLLGTKMAPDSVKARHILLQPKTQNDTQESLKADADSLKQLIKSGKAQFEILAMQLSADQGSAQKGGDLGWFAEGMMVKPFNDAAFEGDEGDMPIVTSQFGVHLIEIQEQGPEVKKYNIGMVERVVEPSTKTYQTFYSKADEFARNAKNAEEFEQAVVEKGLNKRYGSGLKPNDNTIAGLQNPRPLIKWAYEEETEKGDVSKVFEFGEKYVVAVLTEVREEGFADMESVREEIEAEVRKEKKAERFVQEFKDAMGGNSDIAAIGTAVNAPVESANNVSFATGNVPGLGRELKLAGAVSVLNTGEMTKPIKGNNGVFVAVVDNVYEAPETNDYSANKRKIAANIRSRVDYEVFEALKEKAEIVDNRAKFY